MVLRAECLTLQPLKNHHKYLIVIAGPTAVGKTALAIMLAKHYNTVIISADSRQFYREMTIGTAKPNEKELSEVTHHFVNNKSIKELYGAGHFAKDANALILELFKTNDLIIVVGGSGLYINALLNGVDEFEEVPLDIRNKFNAAFKEKGLLWLQNELLNIDPVYYNKVDLNNSQRLIRALEVFAHTGQPYSSFLKDTETEKKHDSINLLINTDRKILYERINQRVDNMMHAGLLEEVKKLLPHKSENALNTVGYKELFDYLAGNCTLEFALEKIKQHTRNYAKRQITWFNNQNDFEVFEPEDLDKIIAYIDIILANE